MPDVGTEARGQSSREATSAGMPRHSASGRAPALPATALTIDASGRCAAVPVSDAPSATPARDPSCEAGWQPPRPPCTTSMGSIETARGCPNVEAVRAAHAAPPPLTSRPLAVGRTRSSQHARPSPLGCTASAIDAPVKHARRQIRVYLALRPLPKTSDPSGRPSHQKKSLRTALLTGGSPPYGTPLLPPTHLGAPANRPANAGSPATAVRVGP